MKKALKVCAAALALSASCSSFAYDWSGPYLGGSIGYSKAEDSGTGYDEVSLTTMSGYAQDAKANGLAAGIFGGYNWVYENRVLFGLEAEYQKRRSQKDAPFQKNGGVIDSQYAVQTDIDAVGSLSVRLGRLFNDNKTLAYLSAGVARADVARTYSDLNSGNNLFASGKQKGWTAGLGVEHVENENLFLRAEIRRTEYDAETVDVDSLWGEFYKQELTENSIVFGIGYRF